MVVDRVDATFQPLGKQRRRPNREIFYEGASGIWQTVWMEPTPDVFVRSLGTVADLESSSLALTVNTGRRTPGLSVEAVVLVQREEISRVTGRADSGVRVPIPQARPWSPDSPFLYDLEVTLRSGDDRRHGRVVLRYARDRHRSRAPTASCGSRSTARSCSTCPPSTRASGRTASTPRRPTRRCGSTWSSTRSWASTRSASTSRSSRTAGTTGPTGSA